MQIPELNNGAPQARRTQLTVIALCFLLEMLDGFDVFAIAYTAPSISAAWTLGPKELGVIFSSGVIGMAVGAMFVSSIADLIGRRQLLLYCLVLITVAMGLTGLTTNMGQLLAARFVTGIGIGAMLASLTAMVSEYAPDRQRNFAIGFMHSAYGIGGMLGGFIAAAVIPRYGWQSVYYIGAIGGAALIPLVALKLPESVQFLIERRPQGSLQRINAILQKLGAEQLEQLPARSAAPERPTVFTLLTPERRNATLLLWLAFFMGYVPLFYLTSWMPRIVMDSGLPMALGFFAGATFNFGTIIGDWTCGYLADRRALRPLLRAFFLAAAVSMVAFGFAPTLWWLLLIMSFVVGFFVLGGFVGLYMVATRLYPIEVRSTGVGWGIGAGRFGAILGPYIGGVLISAGWSTAASFLFFACPLVIAAFAVHLLREPSLQSPPNHP
jgi:AAHS family 4-hydroxybenzoate transporter-like MFS transporter